MSNQHPVKKATQYLSVKTQNSNIVSAAVDSLTELNKGQRGTRIVTAGMAKKVALRSLELNAKDTYSLRLHKALRDVHQFADMARSDTPLTASASNSDLLPIAHPNSTRPNNMDYFDKKTLHARWYSDDPKITDPNVLPLLASAFTSMHDTPEYKYSIARLSAMGPSQVTMQALVAAFNPGANDFFWLQQLRDGEGQFAKMFGFLSSLVRKAGQIFGLNSQVVSTNANNQTFVSETPDGKLIRTPAKSGKSVKAILPSEKTPDGYSKDPVPSSAGDDVINEEDLEFVDSPDGWKKDEAWAPSQEEIDYYGQEGLGTVFADEGDNYEVRKFDSPNEAAKNNFEMAQLRENDGQPVVAYGKGENGGLDDNLPVYLVRRKGEGEDPFAAVQSWADVQQQVTADRSKFEKAEAPKPVRPKSIGKALLSKLRVGNKVESEDVEGKGARIKGKPNANAFRVASYLKMLKRHKEQGLEFPIDPRREHFILDDGTIIDSETGIVVRDNKGNTDPDAWKKPPVPITPDQEQEDEPIVPEQPKKPGARAPRTPRTPGSTPTPGQTPIPMLPKVPGMDTPFPDQGLKPFPGQGFQPGGFLPDRQPLNPPAGWSFEPEVVEEPKKPKRALKLFKKVMDLRKRKSALQRVLDESNAKGNSIISDRTLREIMARDGLSYNEALKRAEKAGLSVRSFNLPTNPNDLDLGDSFFEQEAIDIGGKRIFNNGRKQVRSFNIGDYFVDEDGRLYKVYRKDALDSKGNKTEKGTKSGVGKHTNDRIFGVLVDANDNEVLDKDGNRVTTSQTGRPPRFGNDGRVEAWLEENPSDTSESEAADAPASPEAPDAPATPTPSASDVSLSELDSESLRARRASLRKSIKEITDSPNKDDAESVKKLEDLNKELDAVLAEIKSRDPNAPKPAEEEAPVAELAPELAPEPIEVPEGYYDVTRGEYFPEGAVDGQTSPDFTDDPAQLAQTYSKKDLVTALAQAVKGTPENPATGFGQLPFDDGLEIVPAEALYKALEELGEDADALLDDIYVEGMGEPSPKIATEIEAALGEEVPEPAIADEIQTEKVIPPLIDGLTEEEKAPFVENGDYLPYLPENNVEVEVPEGYFPISDDPWTPLETDIPQDAPDGFSVNPVDIANNYDNAKLIAELRRALEPGNPTPGYGILGIETPEAETYFANVPAEAIRDALQLQGVDTNELIGAIYEEGLKGQDSDEPTPEEIQDAIEGENVEEGQEPAVEPSQEEATPTPEEPTASDEAEPETATPGISTGEPTGPAKLTVKTTDLKPGDISVSDFFTIEDIFADDESEAIKPGSFWVVGYYPGHATQKTKLWNANTEIDVFRNVTPPAKGDLPALSKPKPKEMDPEGKIFKDKELNEFVPKDAEARSKYLDLLDQYNKDLATSKAVWTDAPDVNTLPSWQAESVAAPNSPANPVGYTTVKATEVKPGDITFKKEWGSDFYEFFIVEKVEEKDGMAIVTGYYPGHVSQTKEWKATTSIDVMRGASELPAPGAGPALARPKKGEPDEKAKKEAFKAAKKLSAEGFTPPLDPNNAPALVDAPATAGEAATKPALKVKSPAYPAFTGDRLKQIAAEANGDPVKFMELLEKEELMVLDFETAADGAFDKQTPIQFAYTKFKDGLGIATGNFWMNPEVPLGKWYQDADPADVLKDPSGNVISNEWLAQQKSVDEQMAKALERIGPNTIVVIHNVPFDAQILKRYAEKLGIPYAPAGEIDTLALSRLVINGENGDHKLENVAKRYGIAPEGSWHDANTDTEVLYPMLKKLMEEMGKTKQGIEALNVEANLEKYETDLAAYTASKNKKAVADTSLAVSKPIKDAFDGKETLPTIDELIDSVPKELPNSEELTSATAPSPVEFNDNDFAVQSVLGDIISNSWVDDDQNTTDLGLVQVENWKPGDFFKAVKGGWFEVIEVTPDPDNDKRVFVKRRLLANGKDYLEVNPWIKKRPYEIRRRNGLVDESATPEAPATTPETPAPEATEKWNGYDIKQDSDGVYYAEGISGSDVQKLRNGQLTPPQLPFFAPMGGGNDTSKGDGYFFSTNGSRFWGKFGAAGALVRRKNNKGEYEYFLAKRSSGLSQGGGKWSYPGGAHKDKATAEDANGIVTARDEFAEEVGGDLSFDNAAPIGEFVNPVAPDWSYTTHIFEVGTNQLTDLQPTDGENSETGWFTAQQINKMAEEGSLHSEFADTASTIFGTLNDEVSTADVSTPDAQDVGSVGLGKTFDTSNWTKVSGQAGSNQGAFFVDPATGQQYYVKEAKSELHAANEVLASAFYEQAGLDVGRAYIGKNKSGKMVIVSPVIPGADGTLGQIAPNQKIIDEIRKGFAVDAWLANFDVIGTNKDNIIVANAKPFRIDAGGALLFRAQGQSKAEEMDTDVSEQISLMRDSSINPQGGNVFGDMTIAEIAESAKLVEAISEEKIDELVDAAFAGGVEGISSQSIANKLKENLKRRRKELIEQYGVQETPKPEITTEPEAPNKNASSLKIAINPFGQGDEDSKIASITAQIEQAIANGQDIVFNYNGKTVKISPESVKEAKTGNINVVGTLPSGQYRSFTLSKMEQSDDSTPTSPATPAAPEAPEETVKLNFFQEMVMDALESEGIDVTPEEATKIVNKINDSNALDWSEADDPEVLEAVKDVDAVDFDNKVVKDDTFDPEEDEVVEEPTEIIEPTAPATEAEKPTTAPQGAKAKLLEGLSNIAEAIFGKAANKEQLKSTLNGLKAQEGADVELIDSIIADLDAPEPKPEPSTPAEKVAEDISQDLFPEDPEIDNAEPLTPQEIDDSLTGPDETDPELIWKAVKEDYDGTVLDNGHIVVSSVMHGGVRYDVVVRRTGQNSFAIYHRITNPDGSTKVYTLGSRLHSSKALNNKIAAQINNSKTKPNYVKSKSKAENKDTLLPTSISSVPTTKEAYVSADGTVLKVGSKIKVVNPTHSKFGQTGTVVTLKKKIGADGSYVYTDYIKVKFEDGEKNQIVSQSVTPENSTWNWGDPTPPPKTDGDSDGGGTGGTPVTPPTPTTPAPAAPTPAPTPTTEPAAPSGLSETSTLADAEAVAVDKNSAMHTAHFGASTKEEYKALVKKHLVKDASSNGMNMIPGIIVSNQSPDGADPDLASFGVVTETLPDSSEVDVFYFDGPLKGTTARLKNTSVWSREKFLTAEQGKELGADVNTSIREEALKAQGEKAVKAQEAAVKKAEQEKIQKEAAEKKAAIEKAKQDLLNVDTDIGPGVEVPTTEGPADWKTSATTEVPSLATVLNNLKNQGPAEAANGAQVLIDAGDVEDLKVRIHQVEKNGEKKIRVSFKLTSWAGNQLTKTFAQKANVTSKDNAILPKYEKNPDGSLKYKQDWSISMSDKSNRGRTYSGDILNGQGEFLFIRANRSAVNPDFFTGGTSSNGPIALHNRVDILLPADATPEQIAQAMEEIGGIKNVKPATAANVKVVAENKIITLFGQKADGSKNYKGKLRADILKNVEDNYGFTADDMELRVDTQQKGFIQYLLPEKVAKQLDTIYGAGFFKHNWASQNLPNDAQQRADFVYDLLFKSGGGLYATAVRWSEGTNTEGQSSYQDLSGQGGNFVFTRKTESMDLLTNTTSRSLQFYFDGVKMLRHPELYGANNDAWGAKAADGDYLSLLKNTEVTEILFKENISWADLSGISLDSPARKILLERLTSEGINEIAGKPVKEMFGVKK